MAMRIIEKTKQQKSIIVEEIQERVILNAALSDKAHIYNLKATKINSMGRYDCTFTSATTKVVADAKIRKMPYTYQYIKNDGLFIEVSKYNYLIKKAEETQSIPFYINYVPINNEEGYCILMNLMDMEFKKKNIEIYIGRTANYEQRHIIDIEKTPTEKIYIEYKKIMDENKDFLNQLYLIYANNNYEMQNLITILS
jgi:hypothetical protein